MKDSKDSHKSLRETEARSTALTNSNVESVDPMIRDGVTTMVLAGYSVGHFANDLCASMWFIYLSYYLIYVVKLSQNVSGLCLLSG